MDKRKLFTKKRVAGAVSLVVIAGIVLGGTYALQDFTQHKTNAIMGGGMISATLNDQFDPSRNWSMDNPKASKVVSVTNTKASAESAFIRLQLREYLEAYDSEPIKDDENNVVLFATYADNSTGKIGEYMLYDDAVAMGFKYESYLVPNEPGAPDAVAYARTVSAELRNGVYGKPMYETQASDPESIVTFGSAARADVVGPLQPHSDPGVGEDNYDVHTWPDAEIESDDAENPTLIADYIGINLGTQIMQMDEWEIAGFPTGNFWVLDLDGWAYWASPLAPNHTTANLVESLQLLKVPGHNFEYQMHINMQAVSFEELGLFKSSDGTGKIDNLINKLTAGDSTWSYNGDGTATSSRLVDGAIVSGGTIIVGKDGKAGTTDDNMLLNPAGNVAMSGAQVQHFEDILDGHDINDDNKPDPYVDLGDGLQLTMGADEVIGTYDDVVTGIGEWSGTPLTWYMLSFDPASGEANLLSSKVLDPVAYGAAPGLNLTGALAEWQDSTYRKWLTGTFAAGAFPGGVPEIIVPQDWSSVEDPKEDGTTDVLGVSLLGVDLALLPIDQAGTTDAVWAICANGVNQYLIDPNTKQIEIDFANFAGTKVAWMTRSGAMPLLDLGVNLGDLLGGILNIDLTMLNVNLALGAKALVIDANGDIAYNSANETAGALPGITVKLANIPNIAPPEEPEEPADP